MNDYQRCVEACMDYFAAAQNGDGSFSMPRQDLVAYYKPALAMTIAGRYLEASRALTWVEKNFLTEEGDFLTEPGCKSRVEHFPNHFYYYIHGWLMQSLVLNGRTRTLAKAVAHLLPRQHQSGGFYSQKMEEGKRPPETLDTGSTCSCGFGLLYAGRLEEAARAGDFLVDMLKSQQDQQVFYLRRRSDGGLITDFDEEGPDSMFYRLRKGDSFEMWALGYACAFLSKLWGATAKAVYLDAAQDYLQWAEVYQPESYNTIPSVKIGWGASVYHAASGDQRAREIALQVLDYLVETQLAAGYWYFSDNYMRPAQQPFEIGADLSGEMVLRVCDIRRELEGAG
ncbi:MAG TPA: hypothetical protein VLU25_01605 [Acidobacteriota bacterium]|nr:hypothetical protein [Acidobacteriota bacterium]